MGIKNKAPDDFLPWKSFVNNLLNQHHVDIQRIWRLLGQLFGPGTAPTDGSPWNPVPGTSGFGGGQVYEGFLAGTLGASAADGTSPGTATLNLWGVSEGTWQSLGETITVTNRSQHLWLPSGYPLRCTNVNGEYRPTIQYSPPFGGTLTSSLSAGGTASATVAGVSVTVSPALNLGSTTIASGKGIWVNFVSGSHKVVEAEC